MGIRSAGGGYGMIRLFCRPPYSRSVLLGVLPRSGNGATNQTQRSHSILSSAESPSNIRISAFAARVVFVLLIMASSGSLGASASAFFKAVKRRNGTASMVLQQEGPVVAPEARFSPIIFPDFGNFAGAAPLEASHGRPFGLSGCSPAGQSMSAGN